ncbi:hypothetical protein Pmani_035629 [Petrolisthes manimaculis]|uniref:Bifunctional coenzyme A synthase n=1 Tax=Petrolisthes manimaculis TaxID=1843537 RepID=A0AAE1NLC8_9EUCA|nr:hypothetical protein Pmani_035629 [Petrolisthes manimaculis]
MSHLTGLLILTQPARHIITDLPKVLKEASQYVSKTLYVHLDPLACTPPITQVNQRLTLYSRIINSIYCSSPSLCRGIDVRVLLAGFKSLSEIPLKTSSRIDAVLFDHAWKGSELANLEARYRSFIISKDRQVFLLDENYPTEGEGTELHDNTNNAKANKIYPNVVIGGTFDCIHIGHKKLLSEALLRCQNKFTIGVSEGPLLKNKTLKELIRPCEERIKNVRELVMDIDPSVEYSIVPITDPLGPTRWDPNIDMIVVSEETIKGIDLINNVRREGGIKTLDGYVISLVKDDMRIHQEEEEKISASSQRMRMLGTVLNAPIPNANVPNTPHIIGLTGGSASGKSSVAKRLEKLGAVVIDCDKLGHEAYQKNTNCYIKLIETFGADIIGNDGEINRKILGGKVFGNKDALETLNGIVWPEIQRLANVKIEAERKTGTMVVVLDAAVLLAAGWQSMCHQVWVCILKRAEAVKRIMERDGKTEAEAERRVDSQLSGRAMVEAANVVFCTQWSTEYTQQQVERVWATLTKYIHDMGGKE